MFGILKQKITGFIDKLTRKEEPKEPEVPAEEEAIPGVAPEPGARELPEKGEAAERPAEKKKPELKKTHPEKGISKPAPVKEEKKPEKKERRAPEPAKKPEKKTIEEKTRIETAHERKPEPAAPEAKHVPRKPPREIEREEEKEPEALKEAEEPPIEEPTRIEIPRPEPEKPKPRIKLGAISAIKSFVTSEVEIKEGDVCDMLDNLELELLEGDVEMSVAGSIKEELAGRLVGQTVKKKELHDFIRDSIRDTLADIMESEKKVDLLSLMEGSEKPVRIIFLGVNGSGKCVRGDTLIPLANGRIEKIRDVFENARKSAKEVVRYNDGVCIDKPDVEVFSLNRKTLKIEKRKPAHVWKLKTKSMLIRVKLNNGSEIIVTPEHPFFSLQNGKIQKIKAVDLRKKMCVAVPQIMKVEARGFNLLNKIRCHGFFMKIDNMDEFYGFLKQKYGNLVNAHRALKIKQAYITFISHWKKHGIFPLITAIGIRDGFKFAASRIQYGKARSIPLIETVTKDMAEFVGLVLAEAHLEPRTLELTNKDAEVIERFAVLSKSLFGLRPKVFVDKRGLIRARLMNATLVRFLENAFDMPVGAKATRIKIPDAILQSSDECVKSFLMAYIEADGHIYKEKPALEIATSSKNAVWGLVFLLYRLGFTPTTSKRTYKHFTSYRIFVNGYEKLLRLNDFGFFTTKNLKRLADLKERSRQFVMMELIPNAGTLIKESREAASFLQSELSSRLEVNRSLVSGYESHVSIPRGRLKQISEFLNDDKLRRLAEAELCWVGVNEIEQTRPEDKWVYDLTVEDDHNFVANNIIVHNTTTIAKFAHLLQSRGYRVVLAAADTFRAAAIEQMAVHAERLGAKMIKRDYGADPTSVAYDAVNYAKAHSMDAVFIDTAGRQDTNVSLINELKKMNRVIQPTLKIYVGESIAGNAILEQIGVFHREIGLDGVVLTKLDCDPKGGTMLSISRLTGIPIIYIGTGQAYGDLERFDAKKMAGRIVE